MTSKLQLLLLFIELPSTIKLILRPSTTQNSSSFKHITLLVLWGLF
jgi:hypothetical protein